MRHAWGAAQASLATSSDDAALRPALLVGNFDAAVQICLAQDRLADALMLASCGGSELWARTQAAYFERQRTQLMKLVHCIVTVRAPRVSCAARRGAGFTRAQASLPRLVAEWPLSEWRETLAVLSTFATDADLPVLCDSLGSRLLHEARDAKSATLCFMVAMNLQQTVGIWVRAPAPSCMWVALRDAARCAQVSQAEATARAVGSASALQDVVEKVTVLRYAVEQRAGCEGASGGAKPEAALVIRYADLLANQGALDVAARYAASVAEEESGARARGRARAGVPNPPPRAGAAKVLRDRIFNAKPHEVGPEGPPEFPFEFVEVKPAPVTFPVRACARASGVVFSGGGSDVGRAAVGGTELAVRVRRRRRVLRVQRWQLSGPRRV